VTSELAEVRAPARRLSALRENEPPTGKPPENAAATLATPCAAHSRFGSQRVRSRAAYVRAIDAISAKPTTAMIAPGSNSDGRSPHGSSTENGGAPSGTGPTRAPEEPVQAPLARPARAAGPTPGNRRGTR